MKKMSLKALAGVIAVCLLFVSTVGVLVTSAGEAQAEPKKIVFGVFAAAEYPDMDKIDEAVSAYTLEKYGFVVETKEILSANYKDSVMLMMLGEEQLDLFHNGTLGAFDLVNWNAQGMLADLEPLIDEYCPNVKAALGDYINSGYVAGKLAMVPRIAEMAKAQGITFDKQLIDDAGIDISNIKTLDDMDPILAALKEAYPTVTPMGVNASAETIGRYFYQIDNLGNDVSGVLLNNGQDEELKVVNLYESDVYRETVTKINEWYKAGYISSDISFVQDEAFAQIGAGLIACFPNDLKPGVDSQDSGRAGKEVVSVQLTPALATTSSIDNFGFSITSYSENQKEAAQFLDLLYGDEYIHNLYCYGIEGTHYQWDDEHKFVGFPEGVDATTSGYYPSSNFLYGDVTISYVWQGNEETLYEDTKQWAKDALISQGAGFVFNPANCEAEFAAVTNVYSQYAKNLGNGTVEDVDAAIKEFNDKLYEAGLEVVLAEKQKQFDEWYAANH